MRSSLSDFISSSLGILEYTSFSSSESDLVSASEEGLRGFDFICKTYEIALEDFIISGIDRSIIASMIYSIYKNNGKGIGFSEAKSNETNLKAYRECIKEGLKTFFVPEGAKMETVAQSEPEASSSKAKIISKPKNSKPKEIGRASCRERV